MRAMRLSHTGALDGSNLEPVEVVPPVPGPGQVLLEIEACGVCRTDLHIALGEVAARPGVIPGHQAAGRVRSLGPGVSDLVVGTPVGVGWLASTCGTCRFCESGRENLCVDASFTGRDTDGAFAEQMVADARFAFPMPTGLSAVDAAPLLCAGIIGYRTLRLSEIQPGGRLGLVGFGASAHLALQVALSWNCEVYAFTREPDHRQLALDLGAVWAGDIGNDPGVMLDAAAIFAPAGHLVASTLRRVDRGGTVAVNAIHMTPIEVPFDDLYWERTVRSVTNYTRQDAHEFLELAASVPVRARVEQFPLSAVNDVLARIDRGDVRGAAVVEIGAV